MRHFFLSKGNCMRAKTLRILIFCMFFLSCPGLKPPRPGAVSSQNAVGSKPLRMFCSRRKVSRFQLRNPGLSTGWPVSPW